MYGRKKEAVNQRKHKTYLCANTVWSKSVPTEGVDPWPSDRRGDAPVPEGKMIQRSQKPGKSFTSDHFNRAKVR